MADSQHLEKILLDLLDGNIDKDQAKQQVLAMDPNADFDQLLRTTKILQEGFKGLQIERFQQQLTSANYQGAMELATRKMEGAMSTAEVAALEERRAREPEFAQELNEAEVLLKGFKGLEVEHFAQTLKERHKTQTKAPKSARIRPLFARLAAAAVVLLGLWLGVQYYASANYSNQAIAEAHFKEILESGTRGGSDQANPSKYVPLLEKGQQSFRNMKYAEAAKAYGEAATLLESPGSTTEISYLQVAQWNQMLCHLLLDNWTADDDKTLENVLQDENHPFHSDAMEIHRDKGHFLRSFQ